MTGRRARLEYDPLYCDTIIRRWQDYTGMHATFGDTAKRYEDVSEERLQGAFQLPATTNETADYVL
jgi:hypothetical protein